MKGVKWNERNRLDRAHMAGVLELGNWRLNRRTKTNGRNAWEVYIILSGWLNEEVLEWLSKEFDTKLRYQRRGGKKVLRRDGGKFNELGRRRYIQIAGESLKEIVKHLGPYFKLKSKQCKLFEAYFYTVDKRPGCRGLSEEVIATRDLIVEEFKKL